MIMDGAASVDGRSAFMRMSEVTAPGASKVIQAISQDRALARRHADPSWLV